jgi:osomolarity two-component system, sensor histidine kinase SLN1
MLVAPFSLVHSEPFLLPVAMPALVLFSFNQMRLYATIGATVQFILIGVLLVCIPTPKIDIGFTACQQLPEQRAFVRNEISYFLFIVFFIVLHYYQEQIDRRMFVLRAQLKTSFRAQQKAQMSEKIANNSKRRFVSCEHLF